jgi:hypothetical protein
LYREPKPISVNPEKRQIMIENFPLDLRARGVRA